MNVASKIAVAAVVIVAMIAGTTVPSGASTTVSVLETEDAASVMAGELFERGRGFLGTLEVEQLPKNVEFIGDVTYAELRVIVRDAEADLVEAVSMVSDPASHEPLTQLLGVMRPAGLTFAEASLTDLDFLTEMMAMNLDVDGPLQPILDAISTIGTIISTVGGGLWLLGCLSPPTGAVCAGASTALTVIGVVSGAAAGLSYLLSLDTSRGTVTCEANPQFSGPFASQTNGSNFFPINGTGNVRCSAPMPSRDFIDVRLRGDNLVSQRLVQNSGTRDCAGRIDCGASVSASTRVNGSPTVARQ